MKICVCGWYFDPDFLRVLALVGAAYPVTIVAHRDGLPAKYKDCFAYVMRENRGLEYGAYDHYLQHLWQGEDVLFLHDDMRVLPVVKNFEIIGPQLLFDTVADFDEDLVYIFKNDRSRRECFDIHGRAMFASGRFLKKLKECGGFPWDRANDGYTRGPNPGYCEHYNWGVAQLKLFWEKLFGYRIGSRIIPAFDYAVRGATE